MQPLREERPMSHFLLSTYGPEDGGADGPPTPEQMQTYMERIVQLEEEMAATKTFVFGGALQGVDVASVARHRDDAVSMTDGPFAEAKEQIAGFYIIEAEDLAAAQAWAGKVSGATGSPIEVRPFHATGRVIDNLPGSPTS
jgi:hypothetical protein